MPRQLADNSLWRISGTGFLGLAGGSGHPIAIPTVLTGLDGDRRLIDRASASLIRTHLTAVPYVSASVSLGRLSV
ncbi:MAG: hypothetical protein EOO77_33375 [Oxalobacteraceae bacterium]|nr:MAG: hypothetical protein EOO77_33375 [Oxalobacteraceae bacterium]